MWKGMSKLLRRRHQDDDPLIEFEDGLLLIVDPEQLTHNLRGKLKQFMAVEHAVVYLANGGAKRTFTGFSPVDSAAGDLGDLPDIPADSRTANWFRVNREILLFHQSNPVTQYLREELQAFLDHGIRLAFPLISMDRLIGLVFLRLEQGPVTRAQLGNLQVLSKQAGLAFENALLFKERLRQNERMYRAEQLATMGQFAAGIAHELRNPLAAIRSTVQFLAEEFGDDSERRKLGKTILDEVDRLNGIVGNLLSLARPGESRPVAVELIQEIEKCVAFIGARARSQNVQLEVACAEELPKLFVDPGELRQVLLNILMNGLQAMPDGGILRIQARCLDQAVRSGGSAKDRVLLDVSDQGPGVPEALREKVFDPFFTTKAGGTGLGLPICRSIVRRYDGEIWIERAEAGGTSVKILLLSE